MPKLAFNRIDILILVVLILVGAASSWIGAGRVPSDIRRVENVWFQADIGRVYDNMTERTSDHYRTNVHPLFSLTTFVPVVALRKASLDEFSAVRSVMAAAAGLWLGVLYGVLRAFGLRQPDSIIFAALGAVSAAAIFWSTVPETYIFGSLTILLTIGFAVFAATRVLAAGWFTAFSALSLSMTVTNWMAGLLTVKLNNSWRRSIAITRDAFLVVTLLWAVQHALFPTARFFLFSPEERHYLLLNDASGLLTRLVSFFIHPMVMPAVESLENPWQPSWPLYSVQASAIGSAGLLGWVATLLWLGLLGLGLRGLLTHREGWDRARLVLGLTVLGQLALHMVYGDELFLYSLHWLPLLVLIAGLGSLGPQRLGVLAVAGVLVAGAGYNNAVQFVSVTDDLGGAGNERNKLIAAMEAAPGADWPRGEGHVLLARPGSPLASKGYHEPGGSFSPGFRTFGISLAFFDPAGALAFTSNSLPLDRLTQEVDLGNQAIRTRAVGYDAEWRVVGDHHWQLRLRTDPARDLTPVLRVTSAGPSGGPLDQLRWQETSLRVTAMGVVRLAEAPVSVWFGDEREPPSLEGAPPEDGWSANDGFASASIRLEPGVEHTVDVIVGGPGDGRDHSPAEAGPDLRLELPDSRFRDSLEAQWFHLGAGLVGNETRPGDPANYPLNWLRDGAYVVAALARLGATGLAREFATPFAEHDFFGGFGAEADAPGLAIWALEEVSARLRDPAYDRWIWPHVSRKAGLIETMLASDRDLFAPFSGPVVPAHRDKSYGELAEVAKPARDGLIFGKMDFHYPILYVNSTVYLGLVRAADVAARVGRKTEADRFLELAGEVKAGWERQLETGPDRLNPRTTIAALWPSGIASDQRNVLEALLEESWKRNRTADGDFKDRPEWTYFEVAKAHQWLLLGRPERAWETLAWFWDHQASPGLYTWWEGDGEENSFELWPTVRGWTAPQHVTPHYWTAAEMVHLQLDMLAMEAVGDETTRIVIGAGLPPDWMGSPMSVERLALRSGKLDWAWDGEILVVDWDGDADVEFVPGPAFPASAPFEVRVAAKPQ